jgi:hypothetical protein
MERSPQAQEKQVSYCIVVVVATVAAKGIMSVCGSGSD